MLAMHVDNIVIVLLLINKSSLFSFSEAVLLRYEWLYPSDAFPC